MSNTAKPASTAVPSKWSDIDEKQVNSQFETLLYGVPLDTMKMIHDDTVRHTTGKFIDQMREKILEYAHSNLKGETAIILHDTVSKSADPIIDVAAKNLARKFNGIIERNMTIPKFVTLPGYEDLEGVLDGQEELEKDTEHKLSELELVYNQQVVMMEVLAMEGRAYEVMAEIVETDNTLCALIMEQPSINGNDLQALKGLNETLRSSLASYRHV